MQFFYLMAHALDGFAHSSESLSGEAYGAGQAKHLNSIVRNSLILAFVFALLISLLFAMLGDYMIEGLTTIPSVQNAGKEYLGWLVVMPLVSVLAFQFDGIFILFTHFRIGLGYTLFKAGLQIGEKKDISNSSSKWS